MRTPTRKGQRNKHRHARSSRRRPYGFAGDSIEVSLITSSPKAPGEGAWAPLAIPLFRALWLAEFTGDLGNWMQMVGAQWLLIDRPDAIVLVALVVAAGRLPILLLAVPMGALTDFVDRRKLMIGTEMFQAVVAGTLTLTTIYGLTSPAMLVGYTLLLGLGSALSTVALQSLIPGVVPRAQLPSAVTLAGVNLNLARVVGPAIAGVLVAAVGPVPVFALNACSFLVFVVVLIRYQVPLARPARGALSYVASVRAGLSYVRHSLAIQRILLRSLVFAAPCSALWALLPLVARNRLQLGAMGYGLLLAAVGVGAVVGAAMLPRLRRRLRPNQLTLAGSLLAAVTFAFIASTQWPIAAGVACFFAGMCWLVVQTSLTAALQLALPNWVRGRVLAIYQAVTQGGQALAAFGWGLLAQGAGIGFALLGAGVVMGVGAATIRCWPLQRLEATYDPDGS